MDVGTRNLWQKAEKGKFTGSEATNVLGLLANLKETRKVKRECRVEATRIRSVVNE
jgi:hypothetical protein